MTAEHDEQLEQALTELTTWHGPVPQLWRRALHGATGRRTPPRPRLAWLLHQRVAGAAAACIIVVLGVTIAMNLPHMESGTTSASGDHRRYFATEDLPGAGVSLGRPFVFNEAADAPYASRGREYVRVDPEFMGGAEALGYLGKAEDAEVAPGYATAGAPVRRARAAGGEFRGFGQGIWVHPSEGWEETVGEGDDGGFAAEGAARFELRGARTAFADEGGDRDAGQPRQIVRKATVELLTDDVRAVFLKVAMILSEANGEYVQESSITGSGETAQANLVLRVAAHRLSEVLNALRELGEVRSEQVSGQDVTAQVVDLEARLRNEQRVEVELLELLEKRNDAPLKEILELRNTLSNVRGEIERLTAQRQQLGRLVSLATVLVIIRTDKTQPTDFSIAGYFGDGVANAWQKGLMLLADTCGFLLSVIVGGLIWWILLALVFGAVWRYRRRSVAAANKQ